MEEIFGALIGLAGALETGAKTERTESVIVSALAAPCLPGFDEHLARETADAVRAEKFAVSPSCASCASPCGNTSDFDMARLAAEPPACRNVKREILGALCAAALSLQKGGRRPDLRLFCKALVLIRYPVREDALRETLDDIRTFQNLLEEDETV